MLSFIISQASVFRPGVYDLGWYQHWCDAALVCCGGSLMDIHCTRAWRLLGHSRHSPCPLSSLKGFTLELLKVLHVSKRIAAVSSFWTAIAGSSSPIGIGSSQHTGLVVEVIGSNVPVCLQEEQEYLLGVCRATTANGALDEWVWLIETVYCVCKLAWISLVLRHIHNRDGTKCHVTLRAMLPWLLMVVQGCFKDKW